MAAMHVDKQKPSTGGGALTATSNWVKSYDQFGCGYGLTMDVDVGNIKSCMGTFCTLLWTFVMVVFALQKTDTLMNKKSVRILSSV